MGEKVESPLMIEPPPKARFLKILVPSRKETRDDDVLLEELFRDDPDIEKKDTGSQKKRPKFPHRKVYRRVLNENVKKKEDDFLIARTYLARLHPKLCHHKTVIPQPEKEHHCPVCWRGFSKSEELLTHLSSHLIEKICCFFCGSEFMTKDDLAIHSKIHIPARGMFSCDECGRTFGSPASLKKHSLCHKTVKKVDVPSSCNKSKFKQLDKTWHPVNFRKRTQPNHIYKELLRLQGGKKIMTLRSDKDSEKRSFFCDVCRKTCSNEFSLKSHKKIHILKT